MKNHVPYKDWFIRIQSFELMPSNSWIPRFTLTSTDNRSLCRDRLDKAFLSKDKADAFALEDAKHWIDDHS